MVFLYLIGYNRHKESKYKDRGGNVKKIPYGISNFETIIEDNYLYVDKTKYIEMLEDYAPYQFFIRPRRFGKSLFISMLENYYDINKKDKFNDLFDNLYIVKNPTKQRNKYLVWKISFAGITIHNPGGSCEAECRA